MYPEYPVTNPETDISQSRVLPQGHSDKIDRPQAMSSSVTPKVSILGLDWDETVTDYPLSFRALAQNFQKVVIITVNDELTPEIVSQVLQRKENDVAIFCCPDEELENMAGWKAQICHQQQVDIMFDDNPAVVKACHDLRINAVCISERANKFD